MTPQRTLRALRAVCLLAVVFLSFAAAASAATPRWVQATPFGGPLVALAQAPSAPQTLYAVALTGRVFRSVDGGATWRPRGAWPGDYQIADVVVDPQDARTVYARTNFPELLRSRDGGLTWSEIRPEPDLQLGVSSLALDKDHPGVLFAATHGGLFRTDDGGDSWSLVALEGLSVGAVAIDPHETDTIFAAVYGGDAGELATVWKSTDRGASWTSVSLPEVFPSGKLRFVFDPVRPETLYFTFTGELSRAVLRSTDGGASWSLLPAAVGVRDLAISPDGTLFAATDSGLARSTDGGETWVPSLPAAAPPREPLVRLLVSSSAPGVLFAAGGSGIWKSVDNGATWSLSNQGIVAQGASAVAVAPTGPPAVFAVAWSGLFRSADQGATWARLHSAFDDPQPYVITAFDPRRPRTIYGIGTDGQAAYPVASTNGGRQWTKLPIPYNCNGGSSVCGVSLSTVALDRDNALLVGGSYFFRFQGTGSFLLRSEDGGRTWEELTPVSGISSLVLDPRRRDTYHAVSCAGLFRSLDAGTTWQKTGHGLPAFLCTSDVGGPTLVIDPQDPRRFYVSTLNRGVFASSDGGATFHAMNRGLENAPVATLLIDPTDSTKLYAGVLRRGVFQWNAEQRKWTPLNRGLPLANFEGAIALDPRNPSILYAASPTQGVFRLDLDDTAP